MDIGDEDEEDYTNEDSGYDCIADIITFLCHCVSKIVVIPFNTGEDGLQALNVHLTTRNYCYRLYRHRRRPSCRSRIVFLDVVMVPL